MTKPHFSLNQAKPSCDHFNKKLDLGVFISIQYVDQQSKKSRKGFKIYFCIHSPHVIPMSRRCKELWNQSFFATKKRSLCVAVRFFVC